MRVSSLHIIFNSSLSFFEKCTRILKVILTMQCSYRDIHSQIFILLTNKLFKVFNRNSILHVMFYTIKSKYSTQFSN